MLLSYQAAQLWHGEIAVAKIWPAVIDRRQLKRQTEGIRHRALQRGTRGFANNRRGGRLVIVWLGGFLYFVRISDPLEQYQGLCIQVFLDRTEVVALPDLRNTREPYHRLLFLRRQEFPDGNLQLDDVGLSVPYPHIRFRVE